LRKREEGACARQGMCETGGAGDRGCARECVRASRERRKGQRETGTRNRGLCDHVCGDWGLDQPNPTKLNQPKPKQVTAEQYEEFYRTTFKAFDKPLTLSHFSLEGQVEFRALLYVPGQVWGVGFRVWGVEVRGQLYLPGFLAVCAPLLQF